MLRPGDRELHYQDGSHRFGAPPLGVSAQEWASRLEAHMQAHREDPDAGLSPGYSLGPGRPAKGEPTGRPDPPRRR